EADLVFDVRCLPNPYYVEELRHKTGLDAPVREYVLKWDQTKGFITRLLNLIDYMIPLYCDEGKSQLVIAIGCTGGHHRSVTIAQLLYEHLIEKGYRASVNHRDIHKN
ncbi:MAG TPA: RNase adaptor protein RapZ, partial [Ruminococcaceae bacterium]|nr:RNase adaptor protein RapZ [Oscillospiraceae bacterium]